MLKMRDLASRSDFEVGPLCVSPSRRRVRGPAGEVQVEPLVMQVLLLLLDSDGRVVTRDELFDQVWGGVIVGDDSLNRVVARVRRIGSEVAPGLFEIETIPRTGYRLTGEIVDLLQSSADEVGEEPVERGVSRRNLVAGGAAAAAVAAGAGLWWLKGHRSNPRFDALMARGDEAFRNGKAFEGSTFRSTDGQSMVDLYGEAVRLNPDSARAWGLLAYFKSAEVEDSDAAHSAALTAQARDSIQRALELDESEPNARVGLYLLEGRTSDWTARDALLRDILKTDPANLLAMSELMQLLQAAGLTRESWSLNERILDASPFARPFLVVRSMKLWIMGRIRDSDSVIDRVRGLWPDYGFAFWVRFLMFAATDRPRAAMAMLDSAPQKLGGAAQEPMWRKVLTALETQAPADVEAATSACLQMARTVPERVNDMVMMLCALGQTDRALEVTEGFLLWRGSIVNTNQANGKAMDDYSRRMTQWLFTPPVAAMRSDPRFARLCDEFGLTAYWRARNVKPDYLVYG